MKLEDLPLADISLRIGVHVVRLQAAPHQNALLAATAGRDLLPFGLMLWESAIPLADALSARRVEGSRILELGAGVGLPGIVAALGGAKVVQVDIDPLAVELAGRNACANGVARHIDRRLADWQSLPPDNTFDFVIGADVIYDTSEHAAVIDVLAKSLAPDGIAILTEPSRLATIAFLTRLEDAGWPYVLTKQRTPDLSSPGEQIEVQLIEVRSTQRSMG